MPGGCLCVWISMPCTTKPHTNTTVPERGNITELPATKVTQEGSTEREERHRETHSVRERREQKRREREIRESRGKRERAGRERERETKERAGRNQRL